MEVANEKEMEAMKQLRENLSDLKLNEEQNADKNLIRWLRARNLNIAAAEQMIRKHFNWYDDMEIQSVLTWQPPAGMTDECPYTVSGYDKNGCPIAILPMGQWKIPKIMNEGKKQEWIKMSLMYFEQVWNIMRRQSKDKDYYVQFSCILDMQGLGWSQLTSMDTMDGIVQVVKHFEANYPETVNCGIIVNAPRIFSIAWNIVKVFVSERTGAKLQFFGSEREKWREALLQVMDSDQFPKKYGGTGSDSTYIHVVDGVCKIGQPNEKDPASDSELHESSDL